MQNKTVPDYEDPTQWNYLYGGHEILFIILLDSIVPLLQQCFFSHIPASRSPDPYWKGVPTLTPPAVSCA
jgi:hypothetical protein